MNIPIGLSVVILVLSVLFTAFFSLSETSYACVNKYKYRALAKEKGNTQAKLVAFMADRFESTLITVLIGNNVFSILISVTSTFLFLEIFQQVLDDTVISLLVSIVMAFIIFLFGDTIPKLLAKRMPDTFAKAFSYPLFIFYILFFPLGILFRGLAALLSRIFAHKAPPEFTEDDLKVAIEEAEEDGLLEENESDIIQRTLAFDDKRVMQILTPLRKMLMVDAYNLSNEKLLAFLRKCPYSRVPVYYKQRERIVGILVVKDFLADYFSSSEQVSFASHLMPVHTAKSSIHLDELIKFFQEKQTQIAIVKKGSQVLGMVTTEDALEELVGDIGEKREVISGGDAS